MSENSTQRVPTLEKPVPDTGELPPTPTEGRYQPVQTGRDDNGGGRFWSTRRVPALLMGVLVLGGSALFLYDIARVRAGQDSASWRRTLADDLTERRLDDTVVVIVAVAAVLAGVWLLVLALTPGLRSVLTMRGEPRARVGLERGAAALVLRDRAMEVPGVRTVSVKVRRSRVRVRAEVHFRELDTVEGELDEALADGVRQLGLAREPRVDLRVHRPAKQ